MAYTQILPAAPTPGGPATGHRELIAVTTRADNTCTVARIIAIAVPAPSTAVAVAAALFAVTGAAAVGCAPRALVVSIIGGSIRAVVVLAITPLVVGWVSLVITIVAITGNQSGIDTIGVGRA